MSEGLWVGGEHDPVAPVDDQQDHDGDDASGEFVTYVGGGGVDVKEIDAAAWKNVGVDDQTKIVWDLRPTGNSGAVSVEKFSDSALEYLSEQPDFKIG